MKDGESSGFREILCVDMDAFFASVEQASNPNLRGKPVAVVGAKERSVVVTSSYEARAKGVKTGMHRFAAEKVCPGLIVIPGRGRKYAAVSSGVAEILKSVSPEFSMYSIDEAFLDITGTGLAADTAAYAIKSLIKRDFGITCTVGAGPNRLIAKMATHINKPDGYYRVTEKEAVPFMDSFKLSDIWGIGRRYVKKFADMGIFSPSELRNLGEEKLEAMLGIPGKVLFRSVSGLSEASIPKVRSVSRSVGHSMTFPIDVISRKEAFAYLLQLSEMVASRARRYSYSGRRVTLTVRDCHMATCSFGKSLSFFTSATHHIYDCVKFLFDQHVDLRNPLRLLGVRLSGIDPHGAVFANVEDFLKNKGDKWRGLYEAMDKINSRFGERAISYGAMLGCGRKGSSVISPSWQPEGARNIDIEDN